MSSEAVSIGTHVRRIGSAVATGGNSNPQSFDMSRGQFTVMVKYTGTITTASIQLQCAADPVNGPWFNLGSASTTNTDHTFSVSGVAAQHVRVAVTITGGGTADIYLAAV